MAERARDPSSLHQQRTLARSGETSLLEPRTNSSYSQGTGL
jgi:hypothetical protein